MNFFLWVFKIRGFEGGIRVPSMGDPIIPLGWSC
jgi:hypothetical protein